MPRTTSSHRHCMSQPVSSFFPSWFLSKRKLGIFTEQGNGLRFGDCILNEVLRCVMKQCLSGEKCVE